MSLILSRAVGFVRRWRMFVMLAKGLGRVKFGDACVVGPHARVARRGRVLAGDRVNIGADFTCEVDLFIGDHVMVSSNVAFIGDDHAYDNPAETIQTQGYKPISRIRLEGDNLIGYGSIILGNVTIGHGAIVGAGSLVTKDLPKNMVCIGRPAQPVRSRFPKEER